MDPEGPRINEAGSDGGNVVPFPRDWFGPREELVPFGQPAEPSAPDVADPAAGESDAPAAAPTAQDFWSEASAGIHDVLPPPPLATPAPIGGTSTARPRRATKLPARAVALAALVVSAAVIGVGAFIHAREKAVVRHSAAVTFPAWQSGMSVAAGGREALAAVDAAFGRLRAGLADGQARAAGRQHDRVVAHARRPRPATSTAAPAVTPATSYAQPVSTAVTSARVETDTARSSAASASGGGTAPPPGPVGPGAPFGPGHLG